MAEYIDKEELLTTAKALQGDVFGSPLIVRAIENAPVVDVEEIKYGKWEQFTKDSKTRTCSNCHISQTVNVYNDIVMFNYCPYCGAKMYKKRR